MQPLTDPEPPRCIVVPPPIAATPAATQSLVDAINAPLDEPLPDVKPVKFEPCAMRPFETVEPELQKAIQSAFVLTSDTDSLLTIISRGYHVVTTYNYVLRKLDSPIPVYETTKRAARIRMLENVGKLRLRIADRTLQGYLDRVLPLPANAAKYHSLLCGPPARPNMIMIYDKKWVAIHRDITLSCANCGKHIQNLKTHTVTPFEKRQGFQPCCFDLPSYTKFGLSCLKPKVKKIHLLTYDIESYPVILHDGREEHRFKCISYREPDGTLATAMTLDDFLTVVIRVFDELWMRLDGSEDEERLLLVSFNGSRYDDLFIAPAYRKRVLERYGRTYYDSLVYSERKRAITHNTLTIGKATLEFCDVLRFTSPTTLAKAAKDYKLGMDKGTMPFTVLNDFCIYKRIKRDADGFFSIKYFNGDATKRQICKDYYNELGLKPQPNDADVWDMCRIYCEQDVTVTYNLYVHLDHMYKNFLTPAILGHKTRQPDFDYIAEAERIGFHPFLLSSMSSMSARLMLHTAQMCTVGYEWPLEATEQRTIPLEPGTLPLMAPTNASYYFERSSVYGGWVKPYFHGIVCDETRTRQAFGHEFVDETMKPLLAKFKIPYLDIPHVMGDIASMYPNGVTYPMPLGVPELVVEDSVQRHVIANLLSCENPCRIPMFICRAKMEPPSNPYFFESTLPQRDPRNSKLCWTYRKDLGQLWQHYNSLDLWIACKGSMMRNDPNSVWKILDIKEMYYFTLSAQIYKNFMITCAQGKREGSKTGNENMRTCFKIVMNGGIGKLGQKSAGQTNIQGAAKLADFMEVHGDTAQIVGANTTEIVSGLYSQKITEFVVTCDTADKNSWPQSHASFMYAATRLMRLEWCKATRPDCPPLLQQPPFPDPFYGDTDSKIHATALWDNMPRDMLGDEVGVYNVETGRSNQNIELEKVSDMVKTHAVISGILGPKTYFVCGVDSNGKQVLKFKCKGQRQFAPDQPCTEHGTSNCKACICEHGAHTLTCVVCAFKNCAQIHESLVPVNKYWNLNSINLCAFVNVLISGQQARVKTVQFDRSLCLKTSRQPEFRVSNVELSRKLSRPIALTHAEYTQNPYGTINVPFLKDVVLFPQNHETGILYPAGEYLSKAE